MRFRIKAALAGITVAAACACAAPVAAEAAFEVEPGSFKTSLSRIVNGVAEPDYQAGAHADLMTSFAFQPNGSGSVGGVVRNVEVMLPVGFAGYPASVKTCAPPQLELEECPADSQIGTIEVALRFSPTFTETYTVPVYNMVPPPNETAVFGFVVAHFASIDIALSLGPDYRVHAVVKNAFAVTEITHQSLTVWGVPADPSHNEQRGGKYVCRAEATQEERKKCEGGGVAANENPVPFLVNPTQCTAGPLTAELTVESWESSVSSTARTNVGPFTRSCESPQVRTDDLGAAGTGAGDDPDGLRDQPERPAD